MSTDELEVNGQIPAGFVTEYYAELAPEDREPYVEGQLESWAAAHYRAAQSRTPGSGVWVGTISDVGGTVLAIVSDDMPFLVDSVLSELTRRRLSIRLVVHPRFVVDRDPMGTILRVSAATTKQEDGVESWIAIELTDSLDRGDAESLLRAVRQVLADVRAAAIDWTMLRNKLQEAAGSLPQELPKTAGADAVSTDKARTFLHWLSRNHFIFLGYRRYTLLRGAVEDHLAAVPGSGLGILRPVDGSGNPAGNPLVLTGTAREAAREPELLLVTKARSRSTVHRDAHLDYIGVKTFNSAGEVTGEHRFLGLFTSSVYNGPVEAMPVISDKIDAVLALSGLTGTSHSGRHLLSILETYPRDELFQIEVDDLFRKVTEIMHLQERRRSRVFVRTDRYVRFATVLVYLPRDRYNTSVRTRVENELRQAYNAVDVEYEARVSSSALARIFFTVWTRPDSVTSVDEGRLGQRVERAVRSWPEGVLQALHESYPAPTAEALGQRWAEAFPPEYRVRYSVEEATEDISRFMVLEHEAGEAVRLYVETAGSDGSAGQKDGHGSMRLYLREPQSLSRLLPYFENLGIDVLEERPHHVGDALGRSFFLYDLLVRWPSRVRGPEALSLIPEAFGAMLTGRAESDALNKLVLQEGLSWRTVALLRAYTKYLRQLGTPHSFGFIASTLQAYPRCTQAFIQLFTVKFDPQQPEVDRDEAIRVLDEALTVAIADVSTLDAAFVLEALASLVRASVRTNFYLGEDYISIKFDPSSIDVLPAPRPAHEVWVYSPRVEGVHLRFGKTARGGLRWSDRQEDFRTEVLGLVKAQVVKNAVIVPDGAKGGFFAKHAAGLADAGQRLEEGKRCYRTFLRGILDITDNIRFTEGKRIIVAPPHMVRHDGDDPYLVVAADKGTAAFSDIANEVAQSYGYWLGDAFASGGSVGYDHKRMGITDRGAWEAAKIHFSELGLDPATTDFRVAGIGDMSGDVFGNGVLLSRHLRLVAAFDHRHIFLDPHPDAAASFTERRRLFGLTTSSWDDYDLSLISTGGGVWPRTSRRIPLHPAACKALGIDTQLQFITPPDLVRAILTAPVDLLYNGGIGTYIKATTESHADAGDRTNDALRINGNEVRARVVVEGGNLGVTQAGRVEAALKGVLVNTDAIDNSAGVDCSDHEVNIKILVDQQIREGKLPEAGRSGLLADLTDEVAELVLADNVAQNILLLTDRRFPAASFPNYERFMQFLEARGQLDRQRECLPDTQALENRINGGRGLTSPELSVLAAYAKNTLADSIRNTSLVRDPHFDSFLRQYFPQPLAERLGDDVNGHPLRDDIIATMVANDAINIGGVTAIFRLMEETTADETAAAKAFTIASELFGLRDLSMNLVHACADLPAEKWSPIYLDIRRVLDRAMRWFLQYDHQRPIAECVELYRPVVEALASRVPELLVGRDRLEVTSLREAALSGGIPADIARTWAELRESFTLLDIARVHQLTGESLDVIAPVYYTVHERFGIEELLKRIDRLPRSTKWQAMARASLRDDLSAVVPELTVAVLGSGAGGQDQLGPWEEHHRNRLREAEQLLRSAPQDSFEVLSAHIGALRRAASA